MINQNNSTYRPIIMIKCAKHSIAVTMSLTMSTALTLLVWLLFIKHVHTRWSFDCTTAVVEWTWIGSQRVAGGIHSGERCTPQGFLQVVIYQKSTIRYIHCNITLVITGWLISTNKTVLSLHSRLAKKCVYAAIVRYGIGIAAVIRSTIIKILMFI